MVVLMDGDISRTGLSVAVRPRLTRSDVKAGQAGSIPATTNQEVLMFWLLIKCPACGCNEASPIYRRYTAYVDDDLNWSWCCPECREMESEYWAEMWSDHYSSRF